MSRFAPPAGFRPRTLTALAALSVLTAAAWLASPAVAAAGQPAAEGLQTSVYYDYHELSSEQGVRAVYRRILSAAREVCPGYDSKYQDAVDASKECQRQAIARAIARIGDERLAALDAQISPWRG